MLKQILPVALIAVCVLNLQAQEGEQTQPSPEEMQAMMEQWLASVAPTENHKRLEPLVGKWDATVKMWWDPSSEPEISKGSSEARWIMGGRFVMDEFKSEVNGLPFEGMGMTGFDNNRNLYVGSWIDNMSTHILTTSGSCNPEGNVITLYGQQDEPMIGVYGRTVKHRLTIVDKDKHVFEIFDLHAGDDFKVLEITYTRAKE